MAKLYACITSGQREYTLAVCGCPVLAQESPHGILIAPRVLLFRTWYTSVSMHLVIQVQQETFFHLRITIKQQLSIRVELELYS